MTSNGKELRFMRRASKINKKLRIKRIIYTKGAIKPCASKERTFSAMCSNRLRYRLYCVKTAGMERYLVEVGGLGMRAGRDLGEDAAWAFGAYRRIVQGTVTPCTLCDVVEDLRDARALTNGVESARI